MAVHWQYGWGRGGCATDNMVEAGDGVVRRRTRGSWAEAFGDMQQHCLGKYSIALGGVLGGRYALAGSDKQQSTNGEREGGGVRPLTRQLAPCAGGTWQRRGGQQRLVCIGIGPLMHRLVPHACG